MNRSVPARARSWILDGRALSLIHIFRASEVSLLKDFLYEAILSPQGVEPPARDIMEPVSYTQLDVYKRQRWRRAVLRQIW